MATLVLLLKKKEKKSLYILKENATIWLHIDCLSTTYTKLSSESNDDILEGGVLWNVTQPHKRASLTAQ